MGSTNATIHVDLADQPPPRFHCIYNHSPGEFSVKIADSDVTVYVAGTFAQLRDWATSFTGAIIDGRAALLEQENPDRD
jgi:hypothetical protein